MIKKYSIVFLLLYLLIGCGSKEPILYTDVLSDGCIKPLINYYYQTCRSIYFIINDKKYEIPANFKTDLASIPKIIWPIMAPSHSSLIRAAIIHDWFYRKNCEFSRLQTDLIFYHVLRNDGVSSFKASLMYYAVRIFGWNYYNDNVCINAMNDESYEQQITELYLKNKTNEGLYDGCETMDKKA